MHPTDRDPAPTPQTVEVWSLGHVTSFDYAVTGDAFAAHEATLGWAAHVSGEAAQPFYTGTATVQLETGAPLCSLRIEGIDAAAMRHQLSSVARARRIGALARARMQRAEAEAGIAPAPEPAQDDETTTAILRAVRAA